MSIRVSVSVRLIEDGGMSIEPRFVRVELSRAHLHEHQGHGQSSIAMSTVKCYQQSSQM